MGSQKDGSEGADPEDIPSDFFDDFNKDEFMQGLSVVDSWEDDETGKRRIDAETVDSVKDLRELIEGKDDDRYIKKGRCDVKFDNKYKWEKDKEGSSSDYRRSGSRSKLDDYIKPGSRRDPSKTNEAIKRDKEVKVKELLAKHLDDDLRPPGTELDDYYNEGKPLERKKTPVAEEPPPRRRSREYQRSSKVSPLRHRRMPFRSPRREFQRRSPQRNYSPPRKFRRYSPQRRNAHRMSPTRRSPRRSSPPRRSPHHRRRSISPTPYRGSYRDRHSRSRTPESFHRDTFLYPNDPVSNYPMADTSYSKGSYPAPNDYVGAPPEFSYPQEMPYAGAYGPPGYEYGAQPQIPAMNLPQPVPAPPSAVNAVPAPPTPVPMPAMNIGAPMNPALAMNPAPPMNPAPVMVPAPAQLTSPSGPTTGNLQDTQPFDALAQLVADGKLSQQDYLKLTPNKSVSNSLDTKTRVMVLTRCKQALSKLDHLLLPSRLKILHSIIGQEPKALTPKYCSPLKRQAAIDFQFTKSTGETVQQNKQLVDSIIATIGLDKVVSRPKKKMAKNMRDAAVQTTKPYCDVCEIRESTGCHQASTSIDREHFSASTHTQVVEQDLFNSKSIFNPTGSASDSAPISIAHMTPAQLVSQLAARAKTLKQSSDPVPAPNHQWRNPPNYDNRGHYKNYDNYSNYRY